MRRTSDQERSHTFTQQTPQTSTEGSCQQSQPRQTPQTSTEGSCQQSQPRQTPQGPNDSNSQVHIFYIKKAT